MAVLAGAAARQGTQRARRQGSGHAQGADRQRRPQRPHPHLQLPAGPADRPPHQPDAVQAGPGDGRRPRRRGRGAARGARRRAAGGAGVRARERVRRRRHALAQARALGLDRLDAQLLLAHALQQPRAWLHGPRRRRAVAGAAAGLRRRLPAPRRRRAAGLPAGRARVPRPDAAGHARRAGAAARTPRPWSTGRWSCWPGPLAEAPAGGRPGHRQRRDRAGAETPPPGGPRLRAWTSARRRSRWRGPTRQRHAPARSSSCWATGGSRWPAGASTWWSATRPTSPATTRICRRCATSRRWR